MPSGLRPFYSWISLSLSKCATVFNESRPISQVVVLAHSHEEGLTRKQTASGQVLGLLEGQQRLLLVIRGWCRFERRCPGTAYYGGRQQVCRARGGAHARDTSEQANEMERVSERIQRHALTRDTGVHRRDNKARDARHLGAGAALLSASVSSAKIIYKVMRQ